MVVQTPNGFNLDTGGKRVVVDPVTRIEGHMRCEVNVDENNNYSNSERIESRRFSRLVPKHSIRISGP